VSIAALVPEQHLLRKVDETVDFSFIRERVKHLYCEDNGRPALDPVVLFKLLLLGYLYGVRSERQLMREVEVNVAYRWFLGLKLRDKVPDASTLSQNRRRRFSESTIYQEIFDEMVLLAVKKGLASGAVLYTDSTHLKANANKNKFDLEQVQVKPQEYLTALEAAITEDRAARGKAPLKARAAAAETKEIKVSRTDKDSGYMVRDGRPKGFFYLDHRTVDVRHAIITDTHVTPANVHESVPYLGRLDRQRERFGFLPADLPAVERVVEVVQVHPAAAPPLIRTKLDQFPNLPDDETPFRVHAVPPLCTVRRIRLHALPSISASLSPDCRWRAFPRLAASQPTPRLTPALPVHLLGCRGERP
jgi:transposase